MVRLDVIDDGEGIDASELPYIFDMYRQGARSRTKTGLGIGLALVRQLVEMHDGRVGARSDGIDRGTTMTVWLPVSAMDDQRGEAGQSEGSLTGARVMIAIGDPEVAASLEELLKLENVSTVLVPGASQALDILAQQPVDVVIVDVRSLEDPHEFMALLKANPQLADLRSIAVTESDREADRREAFEAGFHAQTGKPLDFGLLLQILNSFAPSLRS